jgi:hypothetical protein
MNPYKAETRVLIWNDQSTTFSVFSFFSLEGSANRGRGGYCDG